MNLSRRSFLGGALTVAAVAVVNPGVAGLLKPASEYPTLYGDGVHDDTLALNDLLAGKPVWCDGELIKDTGDTIRLVGGVYRITSPVVISREGTNVFGSEFIADKTFPESEHILKVSALKRVGLANIYLHRTA